MKKSKGIQKPKETSLDHMHMAIQDHQNKTIMNFLSNKLTPKKENKNTLLSTKAQIQIYKCHVGEWGSISLHSFSVRCHNRVK